MYFHRLPTGFAEILNTPPSGARVFPPIRLEKSTLFIADSQVLTPPIHSPSSLLHYNVHVLKSNLQKAIRRGLFAQALATAQQLIYQDPSEFLRRLPILMCEDTLLEPDLFVKCVWLMAAVSKGYLLTADDGKTLMTIVKTCLEAKGRYNLHATTATTTEDSTDCVSLAFTLRIAFGGMSCDMAFLERLRQRWCVKELPCTSVISSSCGVEETETFTPSKHLLLEAMDFHCFKHMLRECGNVSKEVVWWHSSSINIRPVIGLGAEEQIATETKRREETSWEYTAYAALIHAFQSKKIAEFAGKVVTPAFKQGTLTNWFAKMTDPCC